MIDRPLKLVRNFWPVAPALLVSAGAGFFLSGGAVTGWILAGLFVMATAAATIFFLAPRAVGPVPVTIDPAVVTGDNGSEEAAYGSLVEALPAITWRADADGDRPFMATIWSEITGQPMEQAIPSQWRALVHPDDIARVDAAARMAGMNREPYEIDYRLRDTSGGFRWVSDRGAPCTNAAGEFAGYAGLTVGMKHLNNADGDVQGELDRVATAHKTINEQVWRLAQRYDDLRESYDRLQHNDRMKSDFLAALSDDIEDPVSDLTHTVELFRKLEPTKKQEGYLARIERSTRNLEQVVEHTSSLGALEVEAAHEVSPDLVHVRQLIDRVAASIRTEMSARGVRLVAQVSDRMPETIQTDELRFPRLLSEFVENVIRLAERGPASVSIDQEPGDHGACLFRCEVTFRSTATDEQLARAYYPRIALSGEPTGLGLGTCRRLTEDMDGKIGYRRDKKELTFWFTVDAVNVSPNHDGRRKHSRMTQESVSSNIGQVMDLSLSGVRIRTATPPEGRVEFTLSDEEETIELAGEVAWTRRVNLKKHEFGMRFVDVTPQISARLGRLAARNRLRCVLPDAA